MSYRDTLGDIIANEFSNFARGAVRWETQEDKESFAVFGSTYGMETDDDFRYETWLARKWFRAQGFEVCEFDSGFEQGSLMTYWVFVVSPLQQPERDFRGRLHPNDEEEMELLQKKLIDLTWAIWRKSHGISPKKDRDNDTSIGA